jgi:hypothetical protein
MKSFSTLPRDVKCCEIEYQYNYVRIRDDNKLHCYQEGRDTFRDVGIENIFHLALLLFFAATLTPN